MYPLPHPAPLTLRRLQAVAAVAVEGRKTQCLTMLDVECNYVGP